MKTKPHEEEGDRCSDCEGTMFYPPVENCSCHISPPCCACVDNCLTCDECGRKEEPIVHEYVNRPVYSGVMERVFTRPFKDLGEGKRIFDYDYDSSSGSTMEYRGNYKGDVTPQDIINALGDGTFGHRGPSLYNGHFTYTKITD